MRGFILDFIELQKLCLQGTPPAPSPLIKARGSSRIAVEASVHTFALVLAYEAVPPGSLSSRCWCLWRRSILPFATRCSSSPCAKASSMPISGCDRANTNAPVRIVNIKDSLTRLGQWPWSRSRLAELVQRLEAMGAAAIVFDMLFAEPDRTSPSNLLRLWKNAPPLENWVDRLADYDAEFAKAIRDGPTVTGFALVPTEEPRRPTHPAAFAYIGGDPRPFLPPIGVR